MITSQLNSQLTVLSTLSVSQTGGNQALAEDINQKAQKYLSDYADKASNGKSADKLLEKAAEWVDAAVAQIVSANPSGASAESIFAASASEPAEAASGSSTEETDAVAAPVAKTDAAEPSSDQSAPEKTVAASSTTTVGTAAGSRKDAPASGGGNGAKSENAEMSSQAGAEHAWGTHKTRQGETPAKANRGEAAIAAAEGALNEKRQTFDLDALKSDDGPADPRLEAMKRALSQLKSLHETGGAATLNGLSTGAQADPTDPKDALAPQSGLFAGGAPAQKDSFIKAAVAYASARAATAS